MVIVSIIIGIILIILGILGFAHYRNDKFFKPFLKKFWWILLFPIADLISTIVFIERIGIEYEGNPLTKYLYLELGYPGLIINYVFTCFIIFMLFCGVFFLSNYAFKTKKVKKKYTRKQWINLDFKTAKIIFIIIYISVVIWNLYWGLTL